MRIQEQTKSCIKKNPPGKIRRDHKNYLILKLILDDQPFLNGFSIVNYGKNINTI